ncbi:MAG: transketolase [Candidatus Omnitrophica bacterium]|nr:transketolase [Candidatus Omnitrophota bacterium]
MNQRPDILMLKRKAVEIRKDIVTMLYRAGSGHPGGSLSIVDILVVLYYYALRYNVRDPQWRERDKLLLSKGHACPALYAILADRGYFPREELWTLRKLGSRLQGHPQLGLPGLEISSGSLGQGLSIANGMALANRMDGIESRIYCIMGDGETNEGQVWEAAMTASHYKLNKLCAIVDRNKLQIDGLCCDVKDMKQFDAKWQSFGWEVVETDGHDVQKLMDAFDKAREVVDKPQVIIAHTIKGAGVSFMENKVEWHGIAPKKEEYEKAVRELDAALAEIR